VREAVIPRWVGMILVLASGGLLAGSCMTHDARQAFLEAALVEPWDQTAPETLNDCLNPSGNPTWQLFVDAFYEAMATISGQVVRQTNPDDRPPM